MSATYSLITSISYIFLIKVKLMIQKYIELTISLREVNISPAISLS